MRYLIILILAACTPETEIYVDGREIHQPYRKCDIEVYTMVDGIEFKECY